MISREEILRVMEDLSREVEKVDFQQYWSGFTPLPFALYNNEAIYLINHPCPPADFQREGNVFVGTWRNGFFGNTAIMFEGHYTAIYNLNYLGPVIFPKLFSMIVHEMFHGYQYTQGFEVKYREDMVLRYPFTRENLALRLAEREELVRAVFAKAMQDKMAALERFIACRETRRRLIGSYLDYELGVESQEGTAYYVEYEALLQVSHMPQEYLLAMAGKDMAGPVMSLDNFRASFYSSGMYICIMLDQLGFDWQAEYLQSGKFLYSYLVEKVGPTEEEVRVIDYFNADFLVEQLHQKQEQKRQKYAELTGIEVVLRGTLELTGFDPMNMFNLGDVVFHEHFLGVKCGGARVFIKKPTLAVFVDDPQYLTEIRFKVSNPPVMDEGVVEISEVGKFAGRLELEDQRYVVYLD